MGLSDTTRLLIVTGFLGGLTTFSTFSAETVGLFLKGEIASTVLLVTSHLAGSLLLTGLGVFLARSVMAR